MEELIATVFEYWKDVLQHPRARLDDKRRKLIQSAMRWGYTDDDLKLAIEGNAWSSHHQGDNDRSMVYDSIELIMRDAEHIDSFMAIGEKARKRFEVRQLHEVPKVNGSDGPVATKEEASAYMTQIQAMLKRKRA